MPRPVLSVILAFGLVNVPVRLYTAAVSKRVQFHLLDSGSGERVRQQLVAPGQSEEPFGRESARAGTSTDRTMPITQSVRGGRSNEDDQDERTNEGVRVIPRQQIVKGYEAVPNQYVQVTSEELKALEAEANQHAEIQEFVALADIDPVYFEKTYLVGPEKGSEKVYRLFARAMRLQKRGAIAKLVMRGKEKLVFIRPTGEDRLLLEVLYYADEVRSDDEIAVGDVALSDTEVQLAKQVIDARATDHWNPDLYHDTYSERLLEFIEQKRKGQSVPTQRRVPRPPVIDLMDALRKSLQQPAQKPAGRSAQQTIRKAKKVG